jgi:hypothetical protein
VLFAPLHNPDDENRCAAMGEPKPQSSRQQELVCLKVAHAECPRYLRGAMAVQSPPPAPRRAPTVPRATLAALLILVLSAGISFGFVVQRGGIELPVVEGAPSSSAVAVVATASPETVTPPPSVEATQAASPEPTASSEAAATPSLEPSPTPEPTATPSPTPAPTTTPAVTPKPTAKPAATPASTRYALLTACPDRTGCWIYRIRSGDNLYSIANYFGHSLSTIYKWNPQYPGTALKVGAKIRMPPPTR